MPRRTKTNELTETQLPINPSRIEDIDFAMFKYLDCGPYDTASKIREFTNIAFPIVRRVFGSLIANDLVSVQPMSLPSGLIFFLDFTHTEGRLGAEAGESLYGGNVVARALTGGVDLSPTDQSGPGGFYDLGNLYSSATGSSQGAIVE